MNGWFVALPRATDRDRKLAACYRFHVCAGCGDLLVEKGPGKAEIRRLRKLGAARPTPYCEPCATRETKRRTAVHERPPPPPWKELLARSREIERETGTD